MAEGSATVQKLFKVLVIGDLGVGKSSIILQYCKKRFDEAYKSTIGVDFTLKTIEWNERTEVRLQLWDIGGECVKHSEMTFTLLTHLLQFDHNCWISLQDVECFHAWKLQQSKTAVFCYPVCFLRSNFNPNQCPWKHTISCQKIIIVSLSLVT